MKISRLSASIWPLQPMQTELPDDIPGTIESKEELEQCCAKSWCDFIHIDKENATKCK